MNVYQLKSGMLQYYVAAEDEDHANEQGTDARRFPDLHFLPFTATKVEVEGVTITAISNELTEAPKTRKTRTQ